MSQHQQVIWKHFPFKAFIAKSRGQVVSLGLALRVFF